MLSAFLKSNYSEIATIKNKQMEKLKNGEYNLTTKI